MNGYIESDAKVNARWNARKQRDDLLIAQANHSTCLLAESMKDCDNCKFQPDVEPWNVIPDSDTVSEIVTVTEIGTRFIVSGGEVLELDSHLESAYDERNGDIETDMIF